MIACLRRNEVIMNKKPKGNQKHLTLSQRLEIEKALLVGDSFAAIARKLDKDPSTISKEVRKHSRVKEAILTVILIFFLLILTCSYKVETQDQFQSL